VGDTSTEQAVISKWDPVLTEHVVDLMRPIAKRYFRSEVRGLGVIPSGGCLVVANHSGGMMTPDWPIFAVAYYDRYGYDRPLYALAHDVLMSGPAGSLFERLGVIRATPENAALALATDGVVLVFPGGAYDAYRPTRSENVVDFGGHTGYVVSAIEAARPIVPLVFLGGQENQFYLSRGRWLSHALRLTKLERKLARTDILPVSFGFPFGLSVLLPVNMPLPTKIVARLLPPIDIAVRFGDNPDVDEVDAHVRSVMQHRLELLARKRRLPIVG
jgi:1-acyl-sn-glycerol-3-phosphate acyltransferase